MKFSRRYIFFTVMIALVFLLRFYLVTVLGGEVESFRGGSIEKTVWYPLVADEVNGKILRVVIDNKEYTNEKVDFYMNEDRNIMVPISILRDALNCSAHVYDGTELLVEKHNTSAWFDLEADSALVNGDEKSLQSAFTLINGQYYISLNDLSEILDYSYSFDIVDNKMTTVDTAENKKLLPTRYDLRDKGRVSDIRNQGIYGTCWAFAATSALESVQLPEKKELYSVDHMSMANSFHVTQLDGGEYTMGMAYLAAWQGPVYEKDDPYGDGKTNFDLEPVAHVQEMRVLDAKDYVAIKEAVFKYGGVQTSLYSTLKSSSKSSEHYNADTYSYCYRGTDKPNHDVLIIGWDDNYSADNFATPLEGDGAFICQNSWGENFGEEGVFYVSYYDTNIGTHNVVYTRIDGVDNYDNIYQSDLLGWVGSLGYDMDHMYGANVYTANKKEELKAVGFYATGPDTTYEVYVVHDFEGEYSFMNRKLVASGTLTNMGYYTVDFEEAEELAKGEDYAVLLYLKTPGSTHPFAIEYDSKDTSVSTIDLSDGLGYISSNGMKFENVMEQEECNLCIKAYTNDVK